MTATVTADFREEFEAESTRRLRKRFMWYCGVTAVINTLSFFGVWFMFANATPDVYFKIWVITAVTILSIVPSVYGYLWAKKMSRLTRPSIIRFVYFIVVFGSLLNLAALPYALDIQRNMNASKARAAEVNRAAPNGSGETAVEQSGADETAHAETDADHERNETIADDGRFVIAERTGENGNTVRVTVGEPNMGLGIGGGWMINLLTMHIFAALFIPWTPREAIAPLIPLLVLNAVLMVGLKLFGENQDTWLTILLAVAFSPLIGLPGTLICWWRHSRYRQKFHYQMLRGRYGEIKAEFSEARKIHEALFPKPIADGPIRMDYIYEPMRQIGGDFLFSRHTHREDGSSVLHVVLIDVTGHGLTAALTVNRIAGEIEREFGVDPDTSPASILTGLNNYIHHTLALHSVYATALALRIDSREDRVVWASAGHPPAFLRGVDGLIERLDSTALVLGACLGDDFVVEELSHRFTPGDALLVYTDGATEARNEDGVMIGVRGLESIMANGRPDEFGGWSATVMRHVEQHRTGPAEDDTLLVEIYKPLTIVK